MGKLFKGGYYRLEKGFDQGHDQENDHNSLKQSWITIKMQLLTSQKNF